jgi:hypothetical protein
LKFVKITPRELGEIRLRDFGKKTIRQLRERDVNRADAPADFDVFYLQYRRSDARSVEECHLEGCRFGS